MGRTEADGTTLNGLEAREIPRLGGSSAAFVILIVVLLLVIIVAGAGIVYLLREDGETSAHRWQRRRRITIPKGSTAHGVEVDDDDEEALGGRSRARGAYQRQGSGDSALLGDESNAGWGASVKRLFWKARRKAGSKSRHPSGAGMLPSSDSTFSPPGHMRRYSANPAPPGRQQGWMQAAASESDWDLRSGNNAQNNANLRMVERRQTDSPIVSAGGSPRSSYFANASSSHPYSHAPTASRMNTSESVTSSVVRFDDSVHLPVRHRDGSLGLGAGGGPTTAPSILSARYFASPTTSPTGSSTALPLASPTSISRSGSPIHHNSGQTPSTPTHGAGPGVGVGGPMRPTQQKLPSRMTMMTSASDVSLDQSVTSESYPSHEYVLANHSPFPAPSPSIRTFGSGSRFVEGL